MHADALHDVQFGSVLLIFTSVYEVCDLVNTVHSVMKLSTKIGVNLLDMLPTAYQVFAKFKVAGRNIIFIFLVKVKVHLSLVS